MRLIDADAIRYDQLLMIGNKEHPLEWAVSRPLINSMPTIEAEPKHGRWIDKAAEDCYRCSVCEEYTHIEMPRLLYHYCPNCGARMDGGEE